MGYDDWLEIGRASLESIRDHVPAIGAALLIVAVGWVLAVVSRRWSRRLSEGFLDRLGASSTFLGKAVESSGVRRQTPGIVAGFVFWLVLLVFLAAAVEVLGLSVMTDLLGELASYAPRLLAAALVSLAGLIGARVVGGATLRAAEASGLAQARGMATAAEVVVIVLVAVIAIEQLGINGRVLELALAIIAGSALAAVALAFGLGARAPVANLIAAHYLVRTFAIGQRVAVDGHRGTIVQLTAVAVVLETTEGRAVVPAQRFLDAAAVILFEAD